MRKRSITDVIIDRICCEAALCLIHAETTEEENEVYDDLEFNIGAVKYLHIGEFVHVPKQSAWINEVMPSYDEARFKQVTRLTYSQFDKVLHLIEVHPVFHTNTQQMAVSLQLAVTLYRFGIYGTGGAVHNVARLFGVGDGSTVIWITRRVITAIKSLREEYIKWPNAEERETIVAATYDDLPRCVGWMDGTHINMEEAPKVDKDSYYNKDKRYSIQCQIIADHAKKIRHFITGYPGSCHDSRVWNDCNIPMNSHLYLSNDQWIGADKGYGLSKIVLTPFRQNASGIPKPKLHAFNKYKRVIIKHVNGALKETFGSLKELWVRIHGPMGHRLAVEWISACLILYNIIMPLNNWIPPEPAVCDVPNDHPGCIDDYSAQDKRMALFYHVMSKLSL